MKIYNGCIKHSQHNNIHNQNHLANVITNCFTSRSTYWTSFWNKNLTSEAQYTKTGILEYTSLKMVRYLVKPIIGEPGLPVHWYRKVSCCPSSWSGQHRCESCTQTWCCADGDWPSQGWHGKCRLRQHGHRAERCQPVLGKVQIRSFDGGSCCPLGYSIPTHPVLVNLSICK